MLASEVPLWVEAGASDVVSPLVGVLGILLKIGFRESYVDPSLFLYFKDSETTYLFTYVDDLVLIGSSERLIEGIIGRLKTEFALRNLGNLSFFLGIQVHWGKGVIHLSQQQYLMNLLTSCDMTNLKPLATPMIPQPDLVSNEPQITQVKKFRQIIDPLQYLTLTCPDVQFAVNKLAQFMCAPAPVH